MYILNICFIVCRFNAHDHDQDHVGTDANYAYESMASPYLIPMKDKSEEGLPYIFTYCMILYIHTYIYVYSIAQW